MAADIQAAISGIVVKNGTAVVSATVTGEYGTLGNNLGSGITNSPTIAEIANKYDNRFDDITYYTIGSGSIIGA